ncbi:hypothetical protein [Pseudoclavibacter soli]|uniref:hypothetical protein n=1 Tax=Pseudoclavibacter soli TaxID=452623 RepID=UPI000488B6B6|nr:hypothetical protein [Pseudoclavibacter soli]
MGAVARVFVDANIFYSKTLRDWLFHLRQETGGTMFTIYSTEDVMSEVSYEKRRQFNEANGRVIVQLVDQMRDS